MIEDMISKEIDKENSLETMRHFQTFIQKDQLVGELFSIDYQSAKVIVHDHARQQVGGIPSLCFLIATRIDPDTTDIDFKEEDSSFILLRVMDSTQLPNHSEAENIRFQLAQKVSGESDQYWDGSGVMDASTRVYLGYSGVGCRIIGTFYLEKNSEDNLILKFGSDISNYYPNRGLKVYKPTGNALELIVNHIDPSNLQEHIERYKTAERVKLGYVRYASTNRKYQNTNDIPVFIYPADLLAQKTALFGMTRTGKSNTTKIIAKAVYELRYPKDKNDQALRIGQLIFDPNGEYANENVQDDDNALKNIWEINSVLANSIDKNAEVVTYGINPHPNDPDRKLMLLNFYEDGNLQIGKEIIDGILQSIDSRYVKNFTHVVFNSPDSSDRSAVVRFKRRVLVYRTILSKAGFTCPATLTPQIGGLFSEELIKRLEESEAKDASKYKAAAKILSSTSPSWDSLASALESLNIFIITKDSGYKEFDDWYINERPKASGDSWADDDLLKLLGIFQYFNGIRMIGEAKKQHSPTTNNDFSEEIYKDLKSGKLVIIDQSSGDSMLNDSSARRIVSKVFEKNKADFTSGKTPSDIMIYVEEAHNLLPPDKDKDYKDIWVRVAKEGAKLRLGLVYATQEVSSIQKNILKNTSNWFISHLNNTDETRELCKFYDFEDFEPSIRRAQDKGFLRVKTLSNLFVIPVQIDKFAVK